MRRTCEPIEIVSSARSSGFIKPVSRRAEYFAACAVNFCQVSAFAAPKPLSRKPASFTGLTERSTPKNESPGTGATGGIHPRRPGNFALRSPFTKSESVGRKAGIEATQPAPTVTVPASSSIAVTSAEPARGTESVVTGVALDWSVMLFWKWMMSSGSASFSTVGERRTAPMPMTPEPVP